MNTMHATPAAAAEDSPAPPAGLGGEPGGQHEAPAGQGGDRDHREQGVQLPVHGRHPGLRGDQRR
jgi:hypothetical protein